MTTCPTCKGKGWRWIIGRLTKHRTTEYCSKCHGTGQTPEDREVKDAK